MNWLYILAIAVSIRAFYSVSTKLATNNLKIHHTTLSTLLVFESAIGALILSPLFGGLDFSGVGEHWFKVLVMVVSLGVGNIIFFKGQHMIDAGTTQIALASKLIWTALLAIPLVGASYDFKQVIGMLLLALAIVLAAGKISKGIASTGALIIALSAVSFSFNSLTAADVANELSAPAYLIISFVGAGLVSLIVGVKYLREDYRLLRSYKSKSIIFSGFASMMSLVYFIAIYYLFRQAGEDRGLAAVLINAQVVTTVILASILLKEKEHIVQKAIAAAMVLISALLVSGQI